MKTVYEHEYYDILVCDNTDSLVFKWKPASRAITDSEFKDSLSNYGGFIFEYQKPHVIVDLRQFQGSTGMDITVNWRNEVIVPRYNQAGITKFAYLVDPKLPGPPVSEPRVTPPEFYANSVFDAEEKLIGWLTSAS